MFIPSLSGFCLSQSTPSGMGVDCILFQEWFLCVMIATTTNMIRKTARIYKRHRYALSNPNYSNTLYKCKFPQVPIVRHVHVHSVSPFANQSLCTVCYIAVLILHCLRVTQQRQLKLHILFRFIKSCKTILETGHAALCTP